MCVNLGFRHCKKQGEAKVWVEDIENRVPPSTRLKTLDVINRARLRRGFQLLAFQEVGIQFESDRSFDFTFERGLQWSIKIRCFDVKRLNRLTRF